MTREKAWKSLARKSVLCKNLIWSRNPITFTPGKRHTLGKNRKNFDQGSNVSFFASMLCWTFKKISHPFDAKWTWNGPERCPKCVQSAPKKRPKNASLKSLIINSWVLNTEINPKAAETLCMLWPLKNAALGQVRKNISKHESNHKSLLRVLIATANIPSSVQEFFSYPSFLQFWWIMFCTP